VRGDAIIVHGFAKEQDATNAKKKCFGGLPQNYFLFVASRVLQFPSTNGQTTRHIFEV